jgi:hypothetical protein
MQRALIIVYVVVLGASTGAAAWAAVTVSPAWKNCTKVQQKYPHGVGRAAARDRTSGTPVKTFKRSDRLYSIAMSNNRGLDRDRDGIACERS